MRCVGGAILMSGPGAVWTDPTPAERMLARGIDLGGVRRNVRAHLGLEVIAEVGRDLVAHLLGGGLAAMLRDARVVLDAHAADVQLVIAGLAHVQPAQRQAQRLE